MSLRSAVDRRAHFIFFHAFSLRARRSNIKDKLPSLFMVRLMQVGFSLLGIIVASIPVDLYLIANYWLEPTGFWQKFLLGVVAVYLLGGIQIMLLIGLIYWLYLVWTDL